MSFCYHRFIAERHPLLCEPRLYRIRAISQCLSLYCLITSLNGLNWWTKLCALIQCLIIIFDYLYISIFWCLLRINCTNVQVISITITKLLPHSIYIIVYICGTINILHTNTYKNFYPSWTDCRYKNSERHTSHKQNLFAISPLLNFEY